MMRSIQAFNELGGPQLYIGVAMTSADAPNNSSVNSFANAKAAESAGE
jgi:hypothetical protein